MNGTWYFIEPNDVWMFRDGRPFAAGESHLIHSLFPPSALTVQGALRALVLHNSSHPLDHWTASNLHTTVGYGNALNQFEMEGPYVACRDDSGNITQIVPLPADVTYTKYGDFKSLEPIHAAGLANFPNRALLPLQLVGTAEADDMPEPAWIGIKTLEDSYLARHTPQRDDNNPMDGIIYSSDLFSDEPRFGIGMDAQVRRPRDSMLYRAAFKRPKPKVGLLVKVSDIGLPAVPTIIGLGGEGRTARITPQPDPTTITLNTSNTLNVKHTGKIKVVLLSPAYFGDTWQPVKGWGHFLGSGVTLAAAAIPRYQTLGGWDFAAKPKPRSRPMVRLVPAGAVFFFEDATTPKQLCLTDNPAGFPPFDKLGFGRFAVGTW